MCAIEILVHNITLGFGRTEVVQVEMVAYNAEQDLFCICTFSFSWQTSGTVKWDYKFNSVNVNPYPQGSQTTARYVLEIILLVMMLANIFMEFQEFIGLCMQFRALEYLTDVFNMIDVWHFSFLILTVAYWARFWQLASGFSIPESFPILHDVSAGTRPFLTNAQQEYEFLVFVDKLVSISDAFAAYTIYSGICVLLFVFRVLKSFDFQERMGLVTRTIEVQMCS
jgi:hypothetical protein